MVSNRFKSSNRFHDVNLSTFYKKKNMLNHFFVQRKKKNSFYHVGKSIFRWRFVWYDKKKNMKLLLCQ